MSPHPTEEDLVLHHYGEGGGAVGAHLLACAECRRTCDALVEALALVGEGGAPEPGPEYGAAVWQRLRPRLAARPSVARRAWPFAALAASLMLAFVLGRASREGEVRQAQAPLPGPVRERILLVAVGDHLERSQLVLVELENASGNGTVDISAEREWAQQLLPANRLFRQAAMGAHEPGVVGVLEDLERVLVEVAMSPDEVPAPELEAIRRRMEEQGILFTVRVLGSRMRERGRVMPAPIVGSQS
jgi:hypothetical protein